MVTMGLCSGNIFDRSGVEVLMKKLEQHDWWPELLEMKDQFSLRELSEKFGASPAAIANALKRNGISRTSAPAGPRRARKSTATPKRRGRKSKLSQFRDQMGKVVDREIAERAGVTVSAVTNYRRRHNIKASGGQGRPRKRPEGAIAPKLHRVGARGYRVVISGESFVVIANDIAEAAAAARRSGRGEVTQIELLGRALG
jgi:hypothetical protein